MAGVNSPGDWIALVHPGGNAPYPEGTFVDNDAPLPVAIVSGGPGGGGGSTQVEGRAADGAPAVGNPVPVGGKDGSGNVQTVLVDSSGRFLIAGGISDGAADAQNPVVIGGEDNNGLVRVAFMASADARLSARVLGVGLMASNGATHDVLRTPTIFKSVSATASGNTTVWTPASTKKFRLMRYCVMVTDNATLAVAGVLTIKLQDSGTDLNQTHDLFVPSAALNTTGDLYVSPWIDLGNGILSATADNVLQINLSAALTAGNARVICCGVEE